MLIQNIYKKNEICFANRHKADLKQKINGKKLNVEFTDKFKLN